MSAAICVRVTKDVTCLITYETMCRNSHKFVALSSNNDFSWHSRETNVALFDIFSSNPCNGLIYHGKHVLNLYESSYVSFS